MALDSSTAARKLVESMIERRPDADMEEYEREASIAFWSIIFEQIFRAIREDAEVLPSGTLPMTAGGDLVVGVGKIV